MKNIISNFDYTCKFTTSFQEYWLSVFPSESVKSAIAHLKSQWQEADQLTTNEFLYEMVIANFQIKASMEETMLRYLNNAVKRQETFQLSLNNFSGHPNGSIYLRVTYKENLLPLLSALKPIQEYIERNGCNYMRYYNNQIIYLWKNLQEDIFLNRMFELSEKTYHAIFPIEYLYLFKKDNYNQKNKLVQILKLSENTINK